MVYGIGIFVDFLLIFKIFWDFRNFTGLIWISRIFWDFLGMNWIFGVLLGSFGILSIFWIPRIVGVLLDSLGIYGILWIFFGGFVGFPGFPREKMTS